MLGPWALWVNRGHVLGDKPGIFHWGGSHACAEGVPLKTEALDQSLSVSFSIKGQIGLRFCSHLVSPLHYIYYYCGQEFLRRNGVAIIVNKRVQNVVLGCNLKNDRIISIHFQGKPFDITVIQVYSPTSSAEEAEVEWFCEDLQDLLELTPKKDVLFIIGDWNAKVGSQETPRVTGKFGLGLQNEYSRAKANRVLPRECTGHSKPPLPTIQEKTLHMDLTRWSTPKSD